jgi:hypothetical protein
MLPAKSDKVGVGADGGAAGGVLPPPPPPPQAVTKSNRLIKSAWFGLDTRVFIFFPDVQIWRSRPGNGFGDLAQRTKRIRRKFNPSF